MARAVGRMGGEERFELRNAVSALQAKLKAINK